MSFDLLSMLGKAQAVIAGETTSDPSATGNPHSDYPWIYPPPGYQAFDFQASIALPAAASADAVVLSFNVPPGWDGVVKRLSCNFSGPGFVQGSGDLIWRILADKAAVKGYDAILTELGDVKTPRPTDGILLFEGQLIQLMVNNVNLAVGGTFVLGSLAGYFWPK